MSLRRQLGVTAIGWLFLLTPLAIVIYAGIRAAPVYLNYLKVVRALEGTAGELKSGANPNSILTAIDKHFEIDMVNYPTSKDFKISRDEGAWLVEAQYDDDAPLFSNISLHFEFDKQVRIGGGD
ncbi:MAG TPA: DUF4845 domain-containing protein [Steroidobacteraceae bacterium]|nr:DUF4845 domain-containing protein [Steroidobacteraceae bacterium]